MLCNACGQETNDTYHNCEHCGRSLFSFRKRWTPQMRLSLFCFLRSRFGNYLGWNAASNQDKQKAIDDLHKLFPLFSKDGILLQIRWGITTQKTIKGSGHVATYMHCKSAAYYANFIDHDDFPKTVTVCTEKQKYTDDHLDVCL